MRLSLRVLLALLLLSLTPVATRADVQENRPEIEVRAIHSPDSFREEGSPLTDPSHTSSPRTSGPIAPAGDQPTGALSGRVVFTSGGHGWTHGSSWFTQRGVNNEICEDFSNQEQMTMFAYYCFNAGATVVAFRPIGFQVNEVVLDNDDSEVTFTGTWNNSTGSPYFGSAGDAIHYRFANLAASETTTATYTPDIPAAGFYPVYTWVRHGSDRGNQLYRIRHTGGESQVRIPHYLVGNGWVYLGTYYFNGGASSTDGAVVISNLRGSAQGSYTFADAIRFGNGMGDIDRGTGVSDYPRENECSRYWVQKQVTQSEGQSSTLYDVSSFDDQDDNIGTPPRMAAEMNSTTTDANIFRRVYVGFHSNAGGGRGPVGLVRSDSEKTPNQQELARLLAKEIDDDLTAIGSPPLEVPWESDRAGYTVSGIYGEINNSVIEGEMDATIIEIGFHDQIDDSKILRDPKGRNWIARAVYQGVLRYFNEFDSAALTFLPEPPGNVRAVATANGITVSWASPAAQGGSGSAQGYVIYRSTDGYGFGNSIGVSGGGTHSLTVTNFAVDTDYYFRIAATNAGGESFPSETVGCRRTSNPATPKVLVVNAFDRFERQLELRQTPAQQNYSPPGSSGTMVRVLPRTINSFDYVVPHGKALAAYGAAFDSCRNETITNDVVALTNYAIVFWACGNESTGDETFSSVERTKITGFLAAGGNLFVSGSEIAWDMDRPTGPGAAKRNFLHNQLHAAYTNDDSTSYTAGAEPGSLFDGRNSVTFDDGTKDIYWVQTPDVIVPFGSGANVAMNYTSGTGGAAAIHYDGSAGGGRVVYFAFPFETITNSTRRNNYLSDIMRFFSKPPRFTSVTLLPDLRPQLVLTGEPGLSYTVLVSSNLTSWTPLTNITATNGTAQFADTPAAAGSARFYRALLVP